MPQVAVLPQKGLFAPKRAVLLPKITLSLGSSPILSPFSPVFLPLFTPFRPLVTPFYPIFIPFSPLFHTFPHDLHRRRPKPALQSARHRKMDNEMDERRPRTLKTSLQRNKNHLPRARRKNHLRHSHPSLARGRQPRGRPTSPFSFKRR